MQDALIFVVDAKAKDVKYQTIMQYSFDSPYSHRLFNTTYYSI